MVKREKTVNTGDPTSLNLTGIQTIEYRVEFE